MTLGQSSCRYLHVGNETADRLAKAGAGLDVLYVPVNLSPQSVKQRISQKILAFWKRRWEEVDTGRFEKMGMVSPLINWAITGHRSFPE